jgi:Zinc finger C-x8-C-x5-C-x3-H type (and similar)
MSNPSQPPPWIQQQLLQQQQQIPAYPTFWNQAHYPVVIPYEPYPPPPPPPPSLVNRSFHCHNCNLILESELAHQAHCNAHTTCSSCPYVASPKLVKAHYQSVHGTFRGSGMKQVTIAIPGCPVQRFQICVGNQPDDIAQWIAERTKRFPRTQQKQQQQQIPPPPTPPTTILGNLLDGYGSSSDSDSNSITKEPTKNPIQTKTQSTPTKKTMDDNYRKPRPCRYFQRNGTCRNGDQCHFSHDQQQQQQLCRQTNTFKTNTKIKTKSSSTLLRKLLTTDQDRETTLTLALLRYLVDCNYLQHQREST